MRRITLFVLCAGVIVTSYPLLAPGHPGSVDVWPHLSRMKIVYESLKQGSSPFWSFSFYSGYPHLRFYSPLFYFAGGFTALFTGGDVLAALKVLLVLMHVLSAWAMYRYLQRRTGDQTAAVLGTLVYVLVPWRVRHIAILANYPQAPIYLLLPLMFLALDRGLALERPGGILRGACPERQGGILRFAQNDARRRAQNDRSEGMEKPDRRNAVWLGLLAACGLLSHIIYSAYALLFLLITLLLGYRDPARGPGRRHLRFLAVAALTALGLSAFFLIPFVLEYRAHVYPALVMSVPAPSLLVALGLKSQLGGFVGGYLGLSVLVLVIAGIVAAFSSKRGTQNPESAEGVTPYRFDRVSPQKMSPIIIGLAASLVLAFIVPLFGEHGSFFNAGLLPERFLLFFVFFGAVLAASAWTFFRTRWALVRQQPLLVFGILITILAIDCVPRHLRVNFASRADMLAGRSEAYEAIARERPAKVLDACLPNNLIDDPARTCTYPATGFIYGDLPTPFGPHYHQFAPRSMLYGYPWMNQTIGDLADTMTTALAPQSLRALALMGISHILMIPPLRTTTAEGRTQSTLMIKQGVNWDTRLLQGPDPVRLVFGATGAGLVLASNRLLPFNRERLVQDRSFYIADDWRQLLDSIRIDQRQSQVNFIAVPDGQLPESLPELPAVAVRDMQIRNQDVRLTVQTSDECFLRLAISYYPELRVRLDNRDVRFHETKDHFVYLRCPAGTHRVEVSARMTLLRQMMFVVSGAGLIFVAVTLIAPRRRRRRPTRA